MGAEPAIALCFKNFTINTNDTYCSACSVSITVKLSKEKQLLLELKHVWYWWCCIGLDQMLLVKQVFQIFCKPRNFRRVCPRNWCATGFGYVPTFSFKVSKLNNQTAPQYISLVVTSNKTTFFVRQPPRKLACSNTKVNPTQFFLT